MMNSKLQSYLLFQDKINVSIVINVFYLSIFPALN